MKTYKNLILEITVFRKRFFEIERRYPDVNQFMSVASRWVLRAKRIKDRDLKRLLIKLKRKTDIMDFSQKDLQRISKFVNDRNLHSIEAVRNLFYGEGKDTEDEQSKSLKAAKKDYNKVYKEMEDWVNS